MDICMAPTDKGDRNSNTLKQQLPELSALRKKFVSFREVTPFNPSRRESCLIPLPLPGAGGVLQGRVKDSLAFPACETAYLSLTES